MKYTSEFKKLVLALASVGLVLPQTGLSQAGETTVPAAQRNIETIADVSLNAQGKLIGQLVDRQGKGKANAVVTIANLQGEVVAKAKTNDQGLFGVELQKGGVYTLAGTQSNAAIRVWKQQAAPPSAHQGVMLVDDAQVVRGQQVEVESEEVHGTRGRLGRVLLLGAAAGLTGVIIADALDQEDAS